MLGKIHVLQPHAMVRRTTLMCAIASHAMLTRATCYATGGVVTLVGDGPLVGAQPALGVRRLPAAQALLAAVQGAPGRHQGEQVAVGTPYPWKRPPA